MTTANAITALLLPHMGNEAMKEKFIAVLRDMNIPGLPAALPNQYPELYRRFKAIIDEAQP